MALKPILLSLLACVFAVSAFGELTFRDGLPVSDRGFGVRRNFYQSGRISAKVSDVCGVFNVNYVGRQDFRNEAFIDAPTENCVFRRNLVLDVLIDDEPYRLPFGETTHYPFGYVSECAVAGVRLRHSLVLDRNVLFRRVTVVSNPSGRKVRARLVQMNVSNGAGMSPWRMNAARDGLVAEAPETKLAIGSLHPATLPLNDRPADTRAFGQRGTMDLRFDLVETEPHDDHLFWLAFDPAADEDLAPARVDRVFSGFAAAREGDLVIETGDPLYDATLSATVPMSAQFEVDGTGAFRASPTYWVWGWDAMVQFGPFAACGRAESVKRMLYFFRRTASPTHGILHCFPSRLGDPGAGGDALPDGAITLPPEVQLLYVVLLNDYFNATGDERTKDELMPFARSLVERALASVRPGETLTRGKGFFPDFPFTAGQSPDDFALINNGVYYQGLRAWNELTDERADEAAAVKRAIETLLWDPAEGFWSDAYDTAAGVRRANYPLYGPLAVSAFAREFFAGRETALADYMRKHFLMSPFLSMFDRRSRAYLADGNQYGAYYPVADHAYWTVQNAAGRVEALAEFSRIIRSHGAVLTYPEGQSSDVLNADPADYSDELGNKQFFSAKGWLVDALALHLGLTIGKDAVTFRPMSDGRPFAVRNLALRGGRLDVTVSGRGTRAVCRLNGKPLAEGRVPYSALTGRDRLEIECKE